MANPNVPEQLRLAPFSTAQAAACGITRTALQGAHWRHVFRDVWMHVDVPDTREMRLDAVRLVLGSDAFLCGLTPAWIYGIDVQDRRGELVWVGCRTTHRLRTRVGCLVRELTVKDSDLQVVNGIMMTTELRTVFDCRRWLSLTEAMVVADAIAHTGAITPEDLAAYTASHRGLRGVRQLDAVLEHLEPLSESPMETRVRVLMVLSGLPRPQAQIIINDLLGQFVARADLGYEEARLIIEYDGALHWKQRRADDLRSDAMRRLGWTVLVVGADDYYQNPYALVTRIGRELAERAA
jgi:very-short-patch-repair endonuclease